MEYMPLALYEAVLYFPASIGRQDILYVFLQESG
jgi:hypothetical protein